jgi:hypothetical protein
MQNVLMSLAGLGIVALTAGCSSEATSGESLSEGFEEARQACTSWALGKTQTIDGVRTSFREAADSAEQAATINPGRWSALAADLEEIYPISIEPTSGSTDRLLQLYDQINAACLDYESWPRSTAEATDPSETASESPNTSADVVDLPDGISQELSDAVFGALEDDLSTTCSNYSTFKTTYVNTMAQAASEGGGTVPDWRVLLEGWLVKNC